MTPNKISVSWSGGKDSSFMLWHLLNDKQFDVVELHTAIGKETQRVSHHGVHRGLIEAQARSIGVPVRFLELPADTSNKSYEKMLDDYYQELHRIQVYHIGLGDIFLEDLRQYREVLLNRNKMIGVYPLWAGETPKLASQFISDGFKTIICAASKEKFPKQITGRDFDQSFLAELPVDVDPCGEHGEFHSFAYDGPIFRKPIALKIGDRIDQTYNNGSSSTTIEFVELSLI